MKSFRDLVLALREMGLDGSHPILVHASLSAFGHVVGGAEAVVGALMEHFKTVIVPTFTYKTMIVPGEGPPDNALPYGQMSDANKLAEFYHPDMPADSLMGIIPETLRTHHEAQRSIHPILSFSGVNANEILDTQRMDNPFAPIASLADRDGWVLLLGVEHRVNTSIHLGERLAGRKTFTRWALMVDLVVECPAFPSCSDGFNAIEPLMIPFTRTIKVGDANVRAMPLYELVETTRQLVLADPLALLCDRPECQRCNAVREDVKRKKQVHE